MNDREGTSADPRDNPKKKPPKNNEDKFEAVIRLAKKYREVKRDAVSMERLANKYGFSFNYTVFTEAKRQTAVDLVMCFQGITFPDNAEEMIRSLLG